MRVLIAEDDPTTRHLLRRLLSEWGHTVLGASDADEAWGILTAAEPPHVVIIDEDLTKGGGLGTCRLVRDLPNRSRMHVIMSMTIVDSASTIAAFEAGADDMVEKPFDVAELRMRVAAACAEVRVRLSEPRGEEGAAYAAIGALAQSHPAMLARATNDCIWEAPTPRVLGHASPFERQHTALASLTKRALSGCSLRDFAAVVVQQLSEVLNARQVQVLERGPDGATLAVRANITLGGASAAAPAGQPFADRAGDGHRARAEIGPASRPYGVLAVDLEAPRGWVPGEREFITCVADLVGTVAQRERLEMQVQQAQKMEMFGRLAGGIAHDFNNVLAVIGTGVSALETRLAADREFGEDVELIGQGVERGRLLARRLLRFSRVPSEAPALIDLNQIVSDGQAMMERILVGQAALVTAVAALPLVVRADRSEVEQILLNLVLNARDAMPTGGVIQVATLAAHPRNAPVDGNYAAFSVIDTGIGMDPSTKARMFEPFFTTKPPGLGTGLGLSTVKEIVRRAEGCIEVDSTPGQGTRITVYWPCAVDTSMLPSAPWGTGNSQSAA